MQRIGYLAILLVAIAFLFVIPPAIAIDNPPTAVTDTFEFETAAMDKPQIIHVSGDVYAIVYEDDSGEGAGKLITLSISSTGDIADTNTIIDSFNFISSSITNPQISAVDSDTFVIVYSFSGGDRAITVDIGADGNISNSSENAVIDTELLVNAGASEVQVVKVDSETFAFILKNSSAVQIFTREISSSGAITETLGSESNFSVDGTTVGVPQITQVDTNTFAIVYRDTTPSNGQIATVDIAVNGNIAASLTDNFTFFTPAFNPQIIPIDTDTYGLLFQDGAEPNSPKLKTIDIPSDGELGESLTILDAFTFDTVAGSTPQMTAVDSDTFAVVWCTDAGNVAFRTIDITAAGTIASAVTETLTITQTSDADNFPQILKISSTVFAVVYKDNSGSDGQLVTITIPSSIPPPTSGGGDHTAPTLGQSSTGQQVVDNGFSYQSNLGGFTTLDVEEGHTPMESMPVGVGGLPEAPPDDITDDVREKLDEQGLGEVANTFDNISDAIDKLGDIVNGPPGEAPSEPQDISGLLDNLKQGIEQSRMDPDSQPNPQQATQINNLLDRIAQKIAEIEGSL